MQAENSLKVVECWS